MQGYTAEEYRFFVRRCLDRIGDQAVETLRSLFRQGKSGQADRLEVVITPTGLLKGIPATLYFTDQFHQQLPGKQVELRAELGPVFSPAETELVYHYDDNGVETLEIELQTLIEWVSDCWLGANPPEAPPAAFLSLENDLEALDLKTMHWIPNPAKTKEKGS